ncbi:MAG: hypothetical protein HQ526_03865 [Actinobacteria bacterium]|nr:hypothetical protein [Actinomycetota bacterium]
MRSLEQQVAAARVLAQPLPPLQLPLGAAHGCVLAEDVTAAYPVPAFPTAIVDGYAVNTTPPAGVTSRYRSGAELSNASFEVIDWLRPGFMTDQPVLFMQAVHLTTGSMVPKSCTAVMATDIDLTVQGESSEATTDSLRAASALDAFEAVVDIRDSVEPGAGIARTGSYVAPDDVVLPAGTALTGRAIAAAAAVGRSRVRAHPKARVVIITVGDQLLDADRAIIDGLVHDSTSEMLLAAARAAGAVAVRGGPVPHDPVAIAIAVEDQCVRADLIVILSSVGSSREAGDEAVIESLGRLGAPETEFCRIDPGTRIGLTTVGPDSLPVVMMDCGALSAFVGFEVVAKPMSTAMSGRSHESPNVELATLGSALVAPPMVPGFVPARTGMDVGTGKLRVEPIRESAHSASLWLYRADSIMIIPADATSLVEGDVVEVVRLSGS